MSTLTALRHPFRAQPELPPDHPDTLAASLVVDAIERYREILVAEGCAYRRSEASGHSCGDHPDSTGWNKWCGAATSIRCSAETDLIYLIQSFRDDVSPMASRDRLGVPLVPRGVIADGRLYVAIPREKDPVDAPDRDDPASATLFILDLAAVVDLDRRLDR